PMAGVGWADVEGHPQKIPTFQPQRGMNKLKVEHHNEVQRGLVEKVAVMYFGSVIAFDEPRAVMADPVVQDAYLGSGV
ncbi:MAG: hypothetical protein ACTHKG_17970, partial [Nocardioides sp.]